ERDAASTTQRFAKNRVALESVTRRGVAVRARVMAGRALRARQFGGHAAYVIWAVKDAQRFLANLCVVEAASRSGRTRSRSSRSCSARSGLGLHVPDARAPGSGRDRAIGG